MEDKINFAKEKGFIIKHKAINSFVGVIKKDFFIDPWELEKIGEIIAVELHNNTLKITFYNDNFKTNY